MARQAQPQPQLFVEAFGEVIMESNNIETRLAVLEALSKERFDRIDKDLADIKKELVPLKIRVYAVTGAIVLAGAVVSVVSRLL